MSYWDDWEWIKAQEAAQQQAQAQPMMGIPGGAATPYGGQYQFDINQLLNGTGAGWGDISQGVGANQGTNEYSKWLHFNGTDGTPLAAWKNYGPDTLTGEGMDKERTLGPLLGYNVITDPGDFGGTGFGTSHESKLNGMGYDYINPDGSFNSKGTLSGFRDAGDGDAMGALKIFLTAVGGGALGGAAGAAGAGAGASAGAAGSLASEMAALGAGGAAGGAGAAATAAGAAGAAGGVGTMPSLPLMSLADTLPELPALYAGASTGVLPGAAAGAAGGAAAGSIFNPAADSQLASSQLGITGGQAAADAAAAGIPSVTVNGVPTGSWLSNLTASGGAVPGAGDVAGGALGGAGSLIPGVTNSQLLGGATTALGGLAGSQTGSGAGGSGGAGGVLDERMEPFLYGSNGLLQQTQNTLNQQQPLAQAQSAQMASVGSGLLGQPIAGNGYGTVGTNVAGNGYGSVGGPVAGNGYGKVQMGDVSSFMNPFYGSMADDMGRRTQDLLGQSFNDIRGNAVATGGLGGSRQGVAEGGAIGKAADSLQGNLAGLGGSMYQSALSGALNKYGTDTNFYGQQRGQDLQGSAQDQAFYGQQRNSDIAKAGQDQSFWNTQRGQDQTGAQLGGGLLANSQTQAFGPLTSASGIYKPYTGLASSAGDGTNWSGLLGGALSGAALAGKMGWWG